MISDFLLVVICEGVVVFQILVIQFFRLGSYAFSNYTTFGELTDVVSIAEDSLKMYMVVEHSCKSIVLRFKSFVSPRCRRPLSLCFVSGP